MFIDFPISPDLLPDANIYLQVDFNNPSTGNFFFWTSLDNTYQGYQSIKVPTKSLYIIQCIYINWNFDLIWFPLIMFVIVNVYFSVFFVIKSKSVSVHLSGMDRKGRSFWDWICRGHVQKAFDWNHNFVHWFSLICRNSLEMLCPTDGWNLLCLINNKNSINLLGSLTFLHLAGFFGKNRCGEQQSFASRIFSITLARSKHCQKLSELPPPPTTTTPLISPYIYVNIMYTHLITLAYLCTYNII